MRLRRKSTLSQRMLGAIIRLGFAVSLWLCAIQSAQADCVSARQASACNLQAQSESSLISRVYGALAYNATSGAVGWSYDFRNASSAERFALSKCAAYGAGCKVVTAFWDGCAALAADDAHRFAIGQGDSRKEAQANAMKSCGGDRGTCEIRVWSCTTRSPHAFAQLDIESLR